MVAAGLLEDGSSTMYVAAANPLEEAALGRLNPNRRWQQTKRIASAPVRACAPALSYIMLKAGLMPTAQLGGSKEIVTLGMCMRDCIQGEPVVEPIRYNQF